MNAALEELASLYVLDHLAPRDRAAFEARLLRDPALAAFVRELETTLARRVRALPPTPPPADLLARIESRLDAAPASTPDDAASARPLSPLFHLPSPASFAGLLRWGLAAVIAISLAVLAVQSLRRPASPQVVFVALDAAGSTLAQLPLQSPSRDADARFLQIASLAERYWEKPDQKPVQLPASDTRRAYALFDPASRQGFFAVEQLPALPSNQRYHLWLVEPDGGVRDAGALPLGGTTRGLYSFSLAPAGDQPGAVKFFVTAEAASEAPSARPRGRIVLGDQRI